MRAPRRRFVGRHRRARPCRVRQSRLAVLDRDRPPRSSIRCLSRRIWSSHQRREHRSRSHSEDSARTLMTTATLIEGDGIGPEIAAATVRAVEAAGGKIQWERADAGAAAVDRHKDPLPNETIESIKKNQLALKGPLATPSGGGYRSVNVTLRQQFDLYANVRPVQTIAGVPSRYTNVDLVIVRENTEDLYAGVEHYVDPRRTAAESIAIITKFGSERVIVYAFEYARRHGRKRVTLVHEANILKMSDGLFLHTGKDAAARDPDLTR